MKFPILLVFKEKPMEGKDKNIVLAIDDDKIQLAVFKGILAKKYDLRTANSASEAMNYIHTCPADAILLDFKMPNISGFDFLNDIRKIPGYVNVPIIIISGNEGKEFLDQAKASTAFAVMSKPVVPEDLIETIEKAISNN
jgi:two-component system chemotaxis response regulator CheY/putative two-component system response regulator